MAYLHVQLLGELRLTHGGEPLGAVVSPRQQALLAWLLLHAGAPQARKRIAFALWPDSDEAQAQTNLRRELHHLRHALPDANAFLEVTPTTLRWRHDAPGEVDVARFEHAAGDTAAELERAADLYRGDLLPGLDDDWLDPFRQALHGRAVEVLEALAARCEQAGERTQALHHWQRLLALEPLRESGYAQVMRLHLASGDVAAARRAYAQCEAVLRAELGVEPGPVVQAVARMMQEAAGPDVLPPDARGAAPLIGRRAEWEHLHRVWAEVSAGAARVLLIAGEAGIGKTRLAESLLTLAQTQGARTARTRSYAAEGRLAYGPISDWLRSAAVQAPLGRLERPWLEELRRLVPELAPDGLAAAPPAPLSEGWQRQRLFEALARGFLLDQSPLLLLLDDLQWCDQDTLEWLHFLLRSGPRAPLLLLCTLRREEQDDNPAVRAFVHHLQERGVLERVELGPLSFGESGTLAASMLRQKLSEQLQTQLFETTEGHPLFIVEAVRVGMASGELTFEPSSRVQAVIAARLAQLSPAARSVTGLAATIGRAFEAGVLRQASDLDEEELAQALDELWQRAIIREQPQHAGAYDFTHDRLREGAYADLSPARRRLLHRRVAQALELQHGVDQHGVDQHRADLGAVAAQLAAHHEQAAQPARAVHFYLQAAERANQVSASQDAVFQAHQALRVLARLPASPERDSSELAAHNTLAASLTALKGFTPPELESTLNRALELARALGDNAATIRSLWGLYALHVVRGNVRLARSLAEQALSLTGEDTGLLIDIHMALGGGDQTEGHLSAAAQHFALANQLYHRHRHRRVLFGADVGVFSLAWGSHGLWLQGQIDDAREQVERAAAIAAELGHPFTQMQASAYRAISYQLQCELESAWATAEETVAGCERHNIAYYREWGVIVGGWVLAQRGDVADGLARIKSGLDALHHQNAALRMPYYLALLAETQLLAGQPEAARAALDGAQAVAHQNSDVWYLPEVHRLRGVIDPARAEDHFRRAFDLAHGQGSRSLELRATTSLAGHLHGTGQDDEARTLLGAIVAAFPDTVVTPDLTAARGLLRTLG
ncbi:AAA family ATPase [Deinococcus sp.]|uniref:ATP-binding protein n=1 Tax=Deinococcus sp. TaxID=47478 RepID=UPI002869A661|nr:AAA family ATPase [Deinococcus sp.]